MVRIAPKLSPAIDDAFSFECSTNRNFFRKIGTVMPYTRPMKRMVELETRVKAQEYRKAITYAATMRATACMSIDSFSDMPTWIVFDELVIMLVGFPAGSLSKDADRLHKQSSDICKT